MKEDKQRTRALFFCWSYHHILIATVKTLTLNLRADIVLVHVGEALSEATDTNVQASKFFEKVYSINIDIIPRADKKNPIKYSIWRFYRLQSFLDKNLSIDFDIYHDVYTFYDFDEVGAYLQAKKIYFHLIEDAIGTFTNAKLQTKTFKPLEKYINSKGLMKIGQSIYYFFPMYGKEKYCLSIEIDNDEDIHLSDDIKNKYIVIPEQTYFDALTDENKKAITNMFSPNIELEIKEDSVLILTEPLYADGKVQSKEEQYAIYEHIIKSYAQDSIVIIKAHPRDKIDYSTLECKNIILDNSFPSEVIKLIPGINFRKYITLESSAIFAFPEEKRLILKEEYANWYHSN